MLQAFRRLVKANAWTKQLLADMLRVGFTQVDLAEALGVNQSNIAKMEQQDDMQSATLIRIISALGGELEIIAHMPNGDYRVTPFSQAEAPTAGQRTGTTKAAREIASRKSRKSEAETTAA